MPPDTDKKLLLEQLRIDPANREDPVGSERRWVPAMVVAAVVVLVAAGVGYYMLRGQRF